MSLHRVLLQDQPPTPWRNGGGLTHELLCWSTAAGDPGDAGGPGAEADEAPGRAPASQTWSLRVSVARIDQQGPFSAFPGIERWFAVLAGAGVRLGRGAGQRRMTPLDPPWGFDGALAPDCELIDGPTLDLNLMVRRAHGQARLWRLAPDAVLSPQDGLWRALYTHGPGRLHTGEAAQDVAAGSLVWSDDDTTDWRFEAATDGPVFGLGWWPGCPSHEANA